MSVLYPSITSEMASRAVKDSIRTSNPIWKNISTKHLIRYVAICCDRDEIVRDKLGEVIPIAKPRTTLHSLFSSSKRARELDSENQFDPPMRHPTPREQTKIIGHDTSAGIRACMDHHYYKINGEVRRQASGGAIGSELTGERARNFLSQ